MEIRAYRPSLDGSLPGSPARLPLGRDACELEHGAITARNIVLQIQVAVPVSTPKAATAPPGFGVGNRP